MTTSHLTRDALLAGLAWPRAILEKSGVSPPVLARRHRKTFHQPQQPSLECGACVCFSGKGSGTHTGIPDHEIDTRPEVFKKEFTDSFLSIEHLLLARLGNMMPRCCSGRTCFSYAHSCAQL